MIDSHVHFDDPRFGTDRDAVYKRALAAGVKAMIVPGVSAATWERTRSVCQQYSNTFPTYGLHPYFIDQHSDQDLDKLKNWIEKEKPIGIGECGLDFFIIDLDREKQKKFFISQLDLAKEFDLPVIVHARKSVEEVYLLLKKSGHKKGMIHSFNGSIQQAKNLVELGFYLSFGGAITYSRANNLHRLIKELPLENILLETDAPDQPDQAHQNQRNEPAFINKVLEFFCEKRNLDKGEVKDKLDNNVINLFSLSTELL